MDGDKFVVGIQRAGATYLLYAQSPDDKNDRQLGAEAIYPITIDGEEAVAITASGSKYRFIPTGAQLKGMIIPNRSAPGQGNFVNVTIDPERSGCVRSNP